MTSKRIPRLLVLFDTNVLYTQIASDLVRADIKRVIKENSSHPDLSIKWFLPEIVVEERRYQMLERAKDLLPNMQKLERLLGHNFGIGEDTLELHVGNAINRDVEEFKFEIFKLNASDVDWNNIISRSARRMPPFDPKEKEKGFRDSIIAECFSQLRNENPSTPNVCRLALVTGDNRLQEYVKEITHDSKNIRILSNLDELESLVNTLVSTVSEEFAAELISKASKLFFEKENDKTLYYKEHIYDKIREKFGGVLDNTIIPGSIRNSKTWWVGNTIFVRKEQRRIYWITTIEPEFEIVHYEYTPSQTTSSAVPNMLLPNAFAPPSSATTPATTLLGGMLSNANSTKVIDFEGREKFEIHWSTNLTAARNLTSPKIEDIKHLGNNLEDKKG